MPSQLSVSGDTITGNTSASKRHRRRTRRIRQLVGDFQEEQDDDAVAVRRNVEAGIASTGRDELAIIGGGDSPARQEHLKTRRQSRAQRAAFKKTKEREGARKFKKAKQVNRKDLGLV